MLGLAGLVVHFIINVVVSTYSWYREEYGFVV